MQTLDRWCATISRALLAVARGCVAAMMVLIMIDVGGRTLFGSPLQGAYILNEAYLMPAIVFMGMAGTYRAQRHVSVTFVSDRLPSSAAKAVRVLALLVCLAIVAALAVATILDAQGSWVRRDTTLGSIEWPVYIARTIPPVGLCALLLCMFVDLLHRTTRGQEERIAAEERAEVAT